MAHQVETMAYTNEVPWHGLGFKVDSKQSVKQMLKAAKIDWTIEKRPLMTAPYDKNGQPVMSALADVSGFFALTRDFDNKVLDVCGSRYTPIQNVEAFEFFNEFVEAGSAHMETAGSLRGGRYVWGLANIGQSFTLAGGDKVNGFLLVACPHEQGKSFIIKFTTVRVVCNNTLTLALAARGKNEFRMSHRRAFDADMVQKAKVALGIAREQMQEFEANARKLKRMAIDDKIAIEVFNKIFVKDDVAVGTALEDLTPTVQKLMGALHNAPGADPKTGWGLLNAATYFADHMASRTADARLTKAWFGKTANQKKEVLELLLAA